MAKFLGVHYCTVARANKELVRRGLLVPVGESEWGEVVPLRKRPQAPIVYEVRTIDDEFSTFPQKASQTVSNGPARSTTPSCSEHYPVVLKALPPPAPSTTPSSLKPDNKIELDSNKMEENRNRDDAFLESEKRSSLDQSEIQEQEKPEQEQLLLREYKKRTGAVIPSFSTRMLTQAVSAQAPRRDCALHRWSPSADDGVGTCVVCGAEDGTVNPV